MTKRSKTLKTIIKAQMTLYYNNGQIITEMTSEQHLSPYLKTNTDGTCTGHGSMTDNSKEN